MSTSFETLVLLVRQTQSMFNPAFTAQQLGEGLRDAMKRLQAAEDKNRAEDAGIEELKKIVADLQSRLPPVVPEP